MKQLKTILNKKLFFLFIVLGSAMSVQAQDSVHPSFGAQTLCQGTGIKQYQVDWTSTAPTGTPGSNYAWSVTTSSGNPLPTPTSTGTNSTTINWSSILPGVYVVHVIESISNCTPSEKTLQVTISPNLPASVSILASANPICSGSSVTFTATPTNGGTVPAYQWFNGATAISGATSSTYTSTTLVNNDAITVQMTSNATCSTGSPATSNVVTMTVNTNLIASVSILASANSICDGSSVTFTATPTNGGTIPAYQWYNGATAISGATSSTYTSTTLVNGDVIKVVMTSNATCSTGSPATSNGVTMIFNALPTTSAIFHD